MRIAFITPEFVTEPTYSGGLANYLGRVTTALAEVGHEVHVFTRSQHNETIVFKNVTVHRVVPLWDQKMILDHVDALIPKKLYNPYQDLKSAWCLCQRWRSIQRSQPFDIVQVANVLSVGFFFRWARSVPVVTRLSSYRPFWDTAAAIPITTSVKLRWLMERLAITGTQYVYAPTQFVAQQVEQNYSIPRVDVIETPFFVEQTSLDESYFATQIKGKSYALYFGRMTPMKGVHVLTQALPEAFDRLPDLHMIFIGSEGLSPSPEYKNMREYIKAYLEPYRDRITFLESMRHEKLYPFIQNAKVVVLPSLMDNLPNTCLESMGLGKLVVATTGTCFEQVITDGASGILVEAGNPQALSAGILRAWSLPGLERQKIEQQAIASIARLHPTQAIPRLVEYYQSVVAASQ
jgi:glycosyltransferase involved in cell wall biosynthesis